VTPTQCFEMLAAIRQKHPTIPIGLLMYANLVFNRGIDEFYAERARGRRLGAGGRRAG
jgi:tryptophan synthase alpha chain